MRCRELNTRAHVVGATLLASIFASGLASGEARDWTPQRSGNQVAEQDSGSTPWARGRNASRFAERKKRQKRSSYGRKNRSPNIIVIIADDLGWADVGYRGSTIATPNIDELASKGVVFDRFYTQPMCTTSRASFLTGRFPPEYAWRVSGAKGLFWATGPGVPVEEYTIAERFSDAGYATALVGKWHQGVLEKEHPNDHGFDYFFGHLGGGIDYVHKFDISDQHDWQEQGEEKFGLHYSTPWLGEAAADWIRDRKKSEPFFLTLSFNAPHFPLQAPREVVQKYERNTYCALLLRERRRCTYMAMVEIMDREIGKIVAVLEKERLREDTLILFFSDNGGDEDFGASNGELYEEKASVYEGGIRAVALANWPGVLSPGVSEQRMRIDDIFRTAEGAAGIPADRPSGAQPQDGINVWPSIVNGTKVPREPFFFVNHDTPPRVVNGQLRLFSNKPRSRAVISRVTIGEQDMGVWKLVETDYLRDFGAQRHRLELFAIEDDPSEESDLANTFTGITELLYDLWD